MTRHDVTNAILVEIYLEWATNAAQKAADAPDPLAKIYYTQIAFRDYDTALHYLEHGNP